MGSQEEGIDHRAQEESRQGGNRQGRQGIQGVRQLIES